jgi:flagellar biosynthesis/type III secretory pathway protein FliH
MKDNYWRRRDGLPKQGRFIKGSDPLVQSLSLVDFSFREICEAAFIETDNERRSVIRPDLHEPESIDYGVRPSEAMQKDLRPAEQVRPVLRPIDFTADWEKQKARATARRQSRLEDEDEFDVELELQKQSKTPKKVSLKPGAAANPASAIISETHNTVEAPAQQSLGDQSIAEDQPEAPNQSKAKWPEEISLQEDSKRKFRAQTDTMDQIGREINRLTPPLPERSPVHLQSDMDEEAQLTRGNELDDSRSATDADASFIPYPSGQSLHSEHHPEHGAVDQYKSRQAEIRKSYQEEISRIFEEAKSQGFNAGYQYGEEKAAIHTREQTTQIAHNLTAALAEVDRLKTGIIKNAEHNFKESLQAIAEVLLRRELSSDPAALSGVIKQAIADGIEGDQIKVFVHPDSFDLLSKSGVELPGKLLRDENVRPGEFRVESSLSIVDGKIADLVRDMITQADLLNKAG